MNMEGFVPIIACVLVVATVVSALARARRRKDTPVSRLGLWSPQATPESSRPEASRAN
jgi:hypothetical protein